MTTQAKNADLTATATTKPAQQDKPQPKPKPKDQGPGKPDKPKPKLYPLQAYAGTVGEYKANPEGIYDSFTLTTADGHEHQVKFVPHFGEALHAAAKPGQAATVLGYLHTTPKGDEHLHIAQVEVAGQQLRPAAPKDGEAADLQGDIGEVLRDPKGNPRALRLSGEATELRFPPHLGAELADHLAVGTKVQASGHRRPDGPGELRAPGTQAPLHLALLTLGGKAFLIK